MHEVIYLQFGNVSNFIGTHFWNAQDTYSPEEVNQQISWSLREGNRSAPILRPRVMIFDRKQNFGTLFRSALYHESDATVTSKTTWGGSTQSFNSPPIPPSRYLAQLEDDQDEEEAEDKLQPPDPNEVRYWSDFNHVYFLPDSVHPLSVSKPTLEGDKQDEEEECGWEEGKGLFEEYDKDRDLMDTSLRRLTEDCDSLQGFQTTLDSLSFGGFGVSLIERIADEYPKCARVDFTLLDDYTAIMGGVSPPDIHKSGLLTNALSLFNLIDFSDLSVPLLPRTMWEPGPWSSLVPGLETTVYHTTAIYTAHIESISWPIRRAKSGWLWDTVIRTLNRDGKSPFSSLSGALPVPETQHWWDYRLDLSTPKVKGVSPNGIAAQYSVARGISPILFGPESGFTPSGYGLKIEDVNAYPIPLSHPQIFVDSSQHRRMESVSTFSVLETRAAFDRILEKHASWCEHSLRKGWNMAGAGPALDADELKEVVEGLRTTAELYAEFGDEGDVSENI